MIKIPYNFPGITVFVPKQLEEKGEIIAIDQKKLIPKDLPKETRGFKVIRVIGNIVLYYKNDDDNYDPSEAIQNFDPPLEIRVGYTINDVGKNKGNYKRLKLAFWNGEKWVIISDSDHDYHILPPDTAQVAEVKISNWAGDPPIAWGR